MHAFIRPGLACLCWFWAVSVGAQTHPIFVINSLDASVSVIDPKTWKVTRQIPTGKQPHHLYLTPDEKSVIVANAGGDSLSFIDPKTAYVESNLRQRLAPFHADVDTAFWQWNDIWLSPAFRPFDIRATCHSIADPVLALQGRHDAYGSLQQINDIQPQGRIQRVVLEDCGHTPHRDQPAQALDAVVDFLASCAPTVPNQGV